MVILHPTGILWVSPVLYSLSGLKWLEHDGDHSSIYHWGKEGVELYVYFPS